MGVEERLERMEDKQDRGFAAITQQGTELREHIERRVEATEAAAKTYTDTALRLNCSNCPTKIQVQATIEQTKGAAKAGKVFIGVIVAVASASGAIIMKIVDHVWK